MHERDPQTDALTDCTDTTHTKLDCAHVSYSGVFLFVGKFFLVLRA